MRTIRFNSAHRTWQVAGLVLAGVFSLSSGAVGQPAKPPSNLETSGQNTPGLASEDPYIRVTQEIWSLIKAKCQLPKAQGYDIAILGVPPDDVRFTADQKDYLAQKISSAASQILRTEPQAKATVSVRDVAEMIAIMGTGESRAKVDEMIRKAENYNVGIQVRGGRVTHRGYRIALTAVGRNGVDCSEQTSAVDLPTDAFPENIIGASELLSRAAQHVLERNLNTRELVVPLRSQMADGTLAPDIWNESLARSFTRSVMIAKSRLPSRSLEANDLRAEPSRDVLKTDSWRTEIVLDNSGRVGTRVEIEVRPPQGLGQEGTAFDGLIDPDSLPPLPAKIVGAAAVPALVQAPPAQTSMANAAPAVQPDKATEPSQTAGAAQGPNQGPKQSPKQELKPEMLPPESVKSAQHLPLSVRPQRFRVALDSLTRRQEFVFSLPQSTVIEVDLQEVGETNVPFIGMIQGQAKLVAPANVPSKARPNLKRWRLASGNYTLWLEYKGQAPIDFVVRTRAAFDSLVPEPLGQLVRVAGEWVVGVREQPNGERVCYAFTPSIVTEPRNWRLLSPFLLFQMTPQSDTVQHRFDGVEDWASPGNVVASVFRGNRWERLRIQPDEGVLRSLERCKKQDGNCLSETTLLGLTTGSKLSLTGPAKNGAQGVVDYSLRGYQAAMYSMATLCGRQSFASRLVLR